MELFHQETPTQMANQILLEVMLKALSLFRYISTDTKACINITIYKIFKFIVLIKSELDNEMYDIHTIFVLQYDPLVQEVFDQARKLRCTWYDYYEKSVTFRPFQVNMLNAVTANFLGDNLQCWMQIQSGKGPWSSEVSGIVKIGQTMTMVSEYNLEQLRLRISLIT